MSDAPAAPATGQGSADGSEGTGRLPPVAYPILGLLFGGALVWSFSRILLAVSELELHVGGASIKGKYAASLIALFVALNVLVGAALVAYGRRVRGRPATFPLLVGAALLLIATGGYAATIKPPAEAVPVQAVALTAEGVKFVQTSLSLTAGEKVSMTFQNKDAGTQHNFDLFDGPDATAPALFTGELVTGPATVKYTFTSPGKPGTYFFQCDVHPTQMTGTVKVTAGAAPPAGGATGGGGGTAGAIALTAKGIAFGQTQLAGASGGQITIHFDNQDASIPHNVVVFNGTDALAPELFRGDPVTGPGTIDYSFKAPPPGTYFFHCEFHPTQMTGTLTVT